MKKENPKRQKIIGEIIKNLRGTYRIPFLNTQRKENAFRVLISTVLSQRTRDENTAVASELLFSKFKNVEQIANANLKDLEKLIRKSGFYHVKAKRIKEISKIILEKYEGKVPRDIEKLLELPGVGRKTANCVLVYAYREPALPVDTHVHKLSNRIGWVRTKTPEQTEIELIKIIPRKYWIEVNQLLVSHGQNTCRPINPQCQKCVIRKYCDHGRKKLKRAKSSSCLERSGRHDGELA